MNPSAYFAYTSA